MSEYNSSEGREMLSDTTMGNIARPSMQQDDHPEHNMPAPAHDGVQLANTFSSFPPLRDSYPIQPGEVRPKPEIKRIVPTLKPKPEKS